MNTLPKPTSRLRCIQLIVKSLHVCSYYIAVKRQVNICTLQIVRYSSRSSMYSVLDCTSIRPTAGHGLLPRLPSWLMKVTESATHSSHISILYASRSKHADQGTMWCSVFRMFFLPCSATPKISRLSRPLLLVSTRHPYSCESHTGALYLHWRVSASQKK